MMFMLRILLPLFFITLTFAEIPSKAPTAQQLPANRTMFNVWKLTPAGKHEALRGDMPLKMILSPLWQDNDRGLCGLQQP